MAMREPQLGTGTGTEARPRPLLGADTRTGIEAKTRRDLMDNKYMVLIAACVGAVAAIGGALAVGMYQLSAEKEKARLEMMRMAAQGNAAQSVRNLQFWNRVGLITLPVSSKDFAQAACDCLNECPAPLKRAACDVTKPAN
jgi:hypothetical protein